MGETVCEHADRLEALRSQLASERALTAHLRVELDMTQADLGHALRRLAQVREIAR